MSRLMSTTTGQKISSPKTIGKRWVFAFLEHENLMVLQKPLKPLQNMTKHTRGGICYGSPATFENPCKNMVHGILAKNKTDNNVTSYDLPETFELPCKTMVYGILAKINPEVLTWGRPASQRKGNCQRKGNGQREATTGRVAPPSHDASGRSKLVRVACVDLHRQII